MSGTPISTRYLHELCLRHDFSQADLAAEAVFEAHELAREEARRLGVGDGLASLVLDACMHQTRIWVARRERTLDALRQRLADAEAQVYSQRRQDGGRDGMIMGSGA